MSILRIAVVGLSVEALAGSPLRTGPESMQIYRREGIRSSNLWMVRGALKRMDEDTDIVAVPLIWATALPGGALTAENYESIKHETVTLLRGAGRLDGLVVINHGALDVDGIDVQADADYVMAMRTVVGPDVPIALALDLHGNMTSDLLRAANLFSAMRTAPHCDDSETGYRAADQLIKAIRQGLRPKTVCIHVPILSSGEAAVTTQEPGRSLYALLPQIDAIPGIMEANILVGFVFNDRPWTGMSVFVTAEADAELAKREAIRLADTVWAQRAGFVLRMEIADLSEGLARAVASEQRPVFVSDSGDNTTAGAPGDLTIVLQAILKEHPQADVVVTGILAPELVKRALAIGPDMPIDVELGNEHISPGISSRLRASGIVESGGSRLPIGGFQPYRDLEAAWARIRFQNVIATFHAEPIGIVTSQHFAAMGISPSDHFAYVVKLGYLYPQLAEIAARHILLTTPGTVPQKLEERTWHQLKRPAYPIDGDFAWSPAGAAISN